VRPLTAVDFFSGAGGLTEGFHQQGVEVLYALDTWRLALESHRLNHPRTAVVREDVLDVDLSDVPRADLVIGSPPCTQFSFANRGGGGDIGLGMKFVLRFLRIVHDLQPRYWVMENVPRLMETLPTRVPLRRLGLRESGHLEIPQRVVLNAADFGVPQARLRLFSGKFPLPNPTHARADSLESHTGRIPWVPAGVILQSLPNPLSTPRAGHLVRDPNYTELEVPDTALEDHFMDTRLTAEEAETCRRSKTDHSWYGRMNFPDRLDRPARTVMATQSGVSRETFVIQVAGAAGPEYRRPTVRECAAFQAFPLSYEFAGTTAEARLKQIGNAVPPPLAGAVARAIWIRSGRRPLPLPRVNGPAPRPIPPAAPPRHAHRRPQLDAYRSFRDHLPGSRAFGVRVDFDNLTGPKVGRTGTRRRHRIKWSGRLYVGSGKSVRAVTPTGKQAVALLAEGLQVLEDRRRLAGMLSDLLESLELLGPTRTGLQRTWARRGAPGEVAPGTLVETLAAVVNRAFPEREWSNRTIAIPSTFPDIGRGSVQVRSGAYLIAASLAAEIVNAQSASASASPLTVPREVRALIDGVGRAVASTPRRLSTRTLAAYT
jgi:DNA (cytosine-5)-methyltransferase 1